MNSGFEFIAPEEVDRILILLCTFLQEQKIEKLAAACAMLVLIEKLRQEGVIFEVKQLQFDSNVH